MKGYAVHSFKYQFSVLWTNDKSLTEGLKTRNFNQFISTEQLMSTE